LKLFRHIKDVQICDVDVRPIEDIVPCDIGQQLNVGKVVLDLLRHVEVRCHVV